MCLPVIRVRVDSMQYLHGYISFWRAISGDAKGPLNWDLGRLYIVDEIRLIHEYFEFRTYFSVENTVKITVEKNITEKSLTI